MIEIILIFLQVLFIGFLMFYSIPDSVIGSKNPINLINTLTMKSVLIMNIFLLFSFLSINTIYLLLALLFSSIFFIINKRSYFVLNFNLKIFFIVIYTFLISIVMANELEFGWDAKFFWFLKTINFYQNNDLLSLSKLPATDYPHLGVYIWSFFWKFPFNAYEYLGRIFYVSIYVLSIFYFCEIFKTSNLYKIILSSLIIITSYSGELFSGNQEVLVFSLVLISTKLSYEILSKKNINPITNIIFLLLLFNAAIWIKNEGVFFIGFMLFLVLILSNITLGQKKILFIASASLIILRISIFVLLDTSLESFQFDKTLNFAHFENLFTNIKIISFYFIVYMVSLPLILVGLILIVYNFYTFKVDKTQIFIICYMTLNLIFIFAAFIFSMENVEWQVRVGLKRVMFETSGFYLLTVAYLFNKNQIK